MPRFGESYVYNDEAQASGGPGPFVADFGQIGRGQTEVGWVGFVTPLWTAAALRTGTNDLDFYRPGQEQGYDGDIRLWKAATPQGAQAIANLHQPAD